MKYVISLFVTGVLFWLGAAVVFSADDEPASKSTYDRFAVIFERNIFSKDRRPPRDEQAPRRVRTTQVLSIYVLRGVAVEKNERTAFVEEQISGQTMKAQVGTEVLNGRIAAIDTNRVLYEQNGTEKYIRIGEELGKTETTVMTEAPTEDAAPAAAAEAADAARPEPAPAETGDESDILKRLMERRQSELGQ